jgi:hypothetical protein
MKKRNSDWQFYHFLTALPVMRRKVDGKWQYRPCTEAELVEYASIEAW